MGGLSVQDGEGGVIGPDCSGKNGSRTSFESVRVVGVSECVVEIGEIGEGGSQVGMVRAEIFLHRLQGLSIEAFGSLVAA